MSYCTRAPVYRQTSASAVVPEDDRCLRSLSVLSFVPSQTRTRLGDEFYSTLATE